MENSSSKPNKVKKIVGVIKKISSKKIFRVFVILLVLFFIARGFLKGFVNKQLNQQMGMNTETALSEKRDIETILSSSGTIEPLNTYEVTTLVEGEVISADFEEGDQVKEGDVLYQITTDSLDTKIESAETAITRAKKNYNKAVVNYKKAKEDYQEAKEKMGDLNIEAEVSGLVAELFVKEGDTLQNGAQIAKVYDNSYMLLSVPFNSSDVSGSWVGKTAQVEMDESGETLKGSVTKVSKIEEVLTGNRVVRSVTIKVKNPGGITKETVATATVVGYDCNSEGTFTALEDTIITADTSGKISKLKFEEGDYLEKGDIIIVLDSHTISEQLDSFQTAIDNAKDSVDSAKDGIEDAETANEEQVDALTDYSITAPISGQIIRKDTLVGDTIKSSSANSTLCVIYDLSAVTFKMSIDELDIMKVKVGQEVEITADALEDVKISGEIVNISLESKSNGGVTQYPVTVRIDEVGDLLPGMNVTGEIIIEKIEDVLAVPVDALMRGNIVYVKDESVTEAVDQVPIGFREVEVEVGLSDENYIQIISGLEEKVEVYVERNSEMIPGMWSDDMDSGEMQGDQGSSEY